jgi:hypothetical protein
MGRVVFVGDAVARSTGATVDCTMYLPFHCTPALDSRYERDNTAAAAVSLMAFYAICRGIAVVGRSEAREREENEEMA